MHDRITFTDQIEKLMPRVEQGAIQFLAMAKFDVERQQDSSYSNQRILDVFADILQTTKEFNVINQVIEGVLQLLATQVDRVSLEWETILLMVEILFEEHFDQIAKNRKLKCIDQIFSYASD